ncbi:MAG TPA: T9SS type A sorting domain-containing protein, partial [Bacteroidia bacterium]|nr:T9SS type A sorting domain-containing protein [Bacteroidia bacterium]
INLKRSGNYTVDMFDILGQNVMSRNFNGAAGKNNITLNVSDLHSGMYLVRVNVGGSVLTSRLMVK